MAIITKPATIEKNSAATIVLNKSQLASEIADAYYADSTNWKEVFIYYKSSTGNQRKILKFNASQTSPEATFLASLKSRNIFQVQKIVVMDFDGGSIIIPRADLVVADFDIDMSPTVTYINYNSLPPDITTDSFGGVTVPVGTSSAFAKAIGTSYVGQDFLLTFNIQATLPTYFQCLVSNTTSPYTSGNSFGFWSYNSPSSVQVFILGSPVGSEISLAPSGNTLKIQRISGNLYFYVNDVLAHTIIGFNPDNETYPTVYPSSGTPVISSSVIL